MLNLTVEQRINLSNKLYPLYAGLSKELLFYIAIDTLFLTVAKGFTAFQISFLGVVPTLICILMQPLLSRFIVFIGNVNSSRLGSFLLLLSSIIITFGGDFILISVGQLLYEISIVLKEMEKISLRNNLEYINKPNLYMILRMDSKKIYIIVTFIIAIICGSLFNMNPYLPMYLCIFCSIINFILSFFFYEIENKIKYVKEKGRNRIKLNKIIILVLLLNSVLCGIVFIGQKESKLFIQYQLTDWYGIFTTAKYLGWMVASSIIIRIMFNKIADKWYFKLENKIPIILSSILLLSFSFVILGSVISVKNITKLLLMMLGFNLIIPVRDIFIKYTDDLILTCVEIKDLRLLFIKKEFSRKVGKFAINLLIALLLIRIDLYYIMWVLIFITIITIIFSILIVKNRKI